MLPGIPKDTNWPRTTRRTPGEQWRKPQPFDSPRGGPHLRSEGSMAGSQPRRAGSLRCPPAMQSSGAVRPVRRRAQGRTRPGVAATDAALVHVFARGWSLVRCARSIAAGFAHCFDSNWPCGPDRCEATGDSRNQGIMGCTVTMRSWALTGAANPSRDSLAMPGRWYCWTAGACARWCGSR